MVALDGMDPEVKNSEPLISITPNGRMPAFHDPNTGAKLWESGAIIEYLLDVYDKENRLSYTSFPEKYDQNCWKHFQMSGQGPYYGQRSWFLHVSQPPNSRTNFPPAKRILPATRRKTSIRSNPLRDRNQTHHQRHQQPPHPHQPSISRGRET